MGTINRAAATAVLMAGLAAPSAARAQAAAKGADVCIAVDEAHDMLSSDNRTGARLLLAREFELAGDHVVPAPCDTQYKVSHVRLGETIVATLSGPDRSVEGTALGLDDLRAVYSQMVRSMVLGRPMTGFNVTDRTNVSEIQAAPAKRVHVDSFGYARLGYGSIFGDRHYGGPTMGFGYRGELDSFGFDVSFLNYQLPSSGFSAYYGESSGSLSGSLLKLEALYFVKPTSNATMYVGGGASYGLTSFGTGSSNATVYRSSWEGSGLQGELTVGYEWPRASALRTFVQADATLPFYNMTAQTYTYSRSSAASPSSIDHRYSPSLIVSVGVGWQRSRR
jgi:hypothetical protein